MPKLSTASPQEAVILREAGYNYSAIARRLGCSMPTAKRLVEKGGAGLVVNRAKAYKPRKDRLFEASAALALFALGMTDREVAGELGCSPSTVKDRVGKVNRRDLIKGLPPPWEFVCSFPSGPFTPTATCDHDRFPFAPGEARYCPVCHRTGYDYHPGMRGRPPASCRPKPPASQLVGGVVVSGHRYQQPERERLIVAEATAKMSRKERRRLQFASRESDRIRATLQRLQTAG